MREGSEHLRSGQWSVLPALICCLAVWILRAPHFAADLEQQAIPFRLAFSSTMFTDVNESDAKAAMKVWITSIAAAQGLPVDPDPHICRSVEELVQVGNRLSVDAFGFTTPEYPELKKKFQFDRVALSSTEGSVAEEYVLLVHQSSRFGEIGDLAGKSINFLRGPRMSMAPIWVETQLLETRDSSLTNFFSRVSSFSKPSPVVLQLFFHQTDACVVTRNAFKLLAELNPQLGKQLKVLLASPKYVPAGFSFRADYSSPYRPQILAEMSEMTKSEVGRQLLTLTQSGSIASYSLDVLDESLALLERHQKLSLKHIALGTAAVSAGTGRAAPGIN